MCASATIGGRGRRSEPQKYLFRPLVEAAIRLIREVEAIRGFDDAVQGRGPRFEPTGKLWRGDRAGGLRIRWDGLRFERRWVREQAQCHRNCSGEQWP